MKGKKKKFPSCLKSHRRRRHSSRPPLGLLSAEAAKVSPGGGWRGAGEGGLRPAKSNRARPGGLPRRQAERVSSVRPEPGLPEGSLQLELFE